MTTVTSDLSLRFARLIAERNLELPTMPGTAAEVMSLCQQETTDAARLSAVLHRDPTIATNVLRVANSAAYMGQIPCASLQQAVGRLGMQQITEIALAVSVRGRLFGNPRCQEQLGALWKHSVLAGFFTKEIARMRRRNVEIAFLCGLLHDVGKAVLLCNVDRLSGSDVAAVPPDVLWHAVDEHHVQAGALLAAEWKLPVQVVEAVQCHHDWQQAKHFADMAMTACLADELSHLLAPTPYCPSTTEEAVRRHPVLAGLNLYGDHLDELLKLRERALQVTEGLR